MRAKQSLFRALAALLAAAMLGTALPVSAFAQQPEEIEACETQVESRLADAVVWNGEEPDEAPIALPAAAAVSDDSDEDESQTQDDEPEVRTVTLAGRTQAEVQDALARYPVIFRAGLAWAEQPDLEAYTTAGALSEDSLQNGLNAVNLMRYVAGLEPVELDETYNDYAQHAAVCDAAIDALTHYPTQANNMPNSFYTIGYENGTTKSNLYWTTASWGGLAEAVRGCMEDTGAKNAQDMGHRRWVLNPTMKKTGFGAAQGKSGMYMSMYAHDGSADTGVRGTLGAADTDGNATPYVAWPCANTPYNWAAGLMTFSLSAPAKSMTDITVTTHSAKTGETCVYSASSSDGYFVYETGRYGAPNCIIFGDYNKQKTPQFDVDDTVAVTVAYTDTTGARVEVHYTISYLDTVDSVWTADEAGGTVLAVAAGAVAVAGTVYLADRYLPVHTVLGRVQDEEGTAISGATVTLYRNGEAVKTTQTNAAGWFGLWGLRRGTYDLTVETQAGKQLYSETRVLSIPATLQNIYFVRDTYRTG
jgi:uncharacterized protein YkwD